MLPSSPGEAVGIAEGPEFSIHPELLPVCWDKLDIIIGLMNIVQDLQNTPALGGSSYLPGSPLAC